MTRMTFGSRTAGEASVGERGEQGCVYTSGPHDSLEDLIRTLQAEISASASVLDPERTICELTLALDAMLPLSRPPVGVYAAGGQNDLPARFQQTTSNDGRTPIAAVHSILNIADPAELAIVQRATSRTVLLAIEAADGFKYSYNNAWSAKNQVGLRFSYVCHDSMQNKDRSANATGRANQDPSVAPARARKPTYDCKGSVSVKFSGVEQSAIVYYRHYAIHGPAAERTPTTRGRPRKIVVPQEASGTEDETAGKVGGTNGTSAAHVDSSKVGRPQKRKREMPSPKSSVPTKVPQSLFDILRQSDAANSPQPVHSTPQPVLLRPPPVSYDLPSWQMPPPPLDKPQNGTNNAPYSQPYRPPQHGLPAPPPSYAGPRPLQPFPNPLFNPAQLLQQATSSPTQGLFGTLIHDQSSTYIPRSNGQASPEKTSRRSTPSAPMHPPNHPAATSSMTYRLPPPAHVPPTPQGLWALQPQQPGSGPGVPWPAPPPPTVPLKQMQMEAGARAESPDPWFPKR